MGHYQTYQKVHVGNPIKAVKGEKEIFNEIMAKIFSSLIKSKKLIRNHGSQKAMRKYIQRAERKRLSVKKPYQAKLYFKND